jgi:hypothetical protein
MAACARDRPGYDDDIVLPDSTPLECGRSVETARRSEPAVACADHYSRSHSRWCWGMRLTARRAGGHDPRRDSCLRSASTQRPWPALRAGTRRSRGRARAHGPSAPSGARCRARTRRLEQQPGRAGRTWADSRGSGLGAAWRRPTRSFAGHRQRHRSRPPRGSTSPRRPGRPLTKTDAKCHTGLDGLRTLVSVARRPQRVGAVAASATDWQVGRRRAVLRDGGPGLEPGTPCLCKARPPTYPDRAGCVPGAVAKVPKSAHWVQPNAPLPCWHRARHECTRARSAAPRGRMPTHASRVVVVLDPRSSPSTRAARRGQ